MNVNKTTEFKIKNLVKSYNKTRVLDVAELTLASGQFVSLMGKNGCGKSTIMRLLAQQELYEAGDIQCNGRSLLSSAVRLNPQTVFISEDHELPFAVPLTYWLGIYRKLYPIFNEGVFGRLIRHLEVDTSKAFHEMSRGQKMKALFCLQAPKRPEIYLLDEITSVLDPGSRWAIMQFLKEEMSRGVLVVMSTNIASEMQGFATQVIFLENGKVIFACDTVSLKEHFSKIRVRKDQEDSVQKKLGARRINFNGDGTWTYLHPRHRPERASVPGVEEDLREITISDVQTYFTAGDVGP